MEEREIIMGCKIKDKRCQELLVKRYSEVLLSVSYRYSKDIEEAKDYVQDAFIIIFNEIGRFRLDEGSFEGWMKRIVARAAVKKFKKKRTFSEVSMNEFTKEISTKARAYDRINVEEVLELIRLLPDGFREVINLHIIEGYSFGEISKMLQISESSVRSRLCRARKALTKKFEIFSSHNTRRISHNPIDE